MRIDWWTIGLQTVNVLILVAILGRFFFRPVAAMVAERRAAAAKLMTDAEAARAAAEAEREAARRETAGIADARLAALKSAEAEAEAQKAKIIDAARTEAARLEAAGREAAQRLRAEQEREAADRASRLAVDIAGRLLARLPAASLVAGFVDGLAAALAGLPQTVRDQLGAEGPLRLKAARALTPGETQECAERLSKALGRNIEIAVEPDQTLIAGLELDAPHAEVRNSFRADLARVAAALTARPEDAAESAAAPGTNTQEASAP